MSHHTEPCPDCGEWIRMPTSDSLVACPACHEHWWVERDDEGAAGTTYRLTHQERCRHHPAAWRSCFNCVEARAES